MKTKMLPLTDADLENMTHNEIMAEVSSGLAEFTEHLAEQARNTESQKQSMMKMAYDFQAFTIFFRRLDKKLTGRDYSNCPNCFGRLTNFFGKIPPGQSDPNPEVLYSSGRTATLRSYVCHNCKRVWLLHWFDIPKALVSTEKPEDEK